MKQSAKQSLGSKANADAQRYVDKACQAICAALGVWQTQASFSGLRINSVTAIGAAGCLKGPKLEALISSGCPMSTDWERKMSKAVAGGVSASWAGFEHSVRVPGLPWYPAFAAWPGPMAPPTPNIPTPFLALSQQSPKSVETAVQSAIKGKAGSISNAALVAAAIAAGLGAAISAWLPTIIVKNVLGKGPVPSFAPPYVPVGPVVAGDTISIPGQLA